MNGLTRRHFVGSTAGVVGSLAIGSLGVAPASATERSVTWTGSRSANGWVTLSETRNFRIEGSDQSVGLAEGDAATILLHIARRYHYEIGQLRDGDIHGHRTLGSIHERYESNYLSGTAIEIRPHAYPLGVRGGFYTAEMVVIRDILAEMRGAVAWGGDFKTPKESHFEIACKPGHPKVTSTARRINDWNAGPGNEGAGATDAFDPKRQSRAKSFLGT